MPVLSLGGMRFQQSWNDINLTKIQSSSQKKLEGILKIAVKKGFRHIETARHYGSSELQLGLTLGNAPDSNRILQTKVPPREDSKVFERELEISFEYLKCEYLDLLSIHGINIPEHLEQILKPNGCMEVVRRWQADGRIGHVGFSTHAPTELIVQAIETNEFDYVNLHWYYIRQDNDLALEAAFKRDLGVFIISPTDKGGHLHTPSKKLLELCSPIHPIIFNNLFCLTNSYIHTISVGIAHPNDFGLHLDSIRLLPKADNFLPEIQRRLQEASRIALGDEWLSTWMIGLPSWNDSPGGINIPILLWLHNLLEAWDMESYAKARYSLLGKGSHWFPGKNADILDSHVSEQDLDDALRSSPWRKQIPYLLRRLRERLGGSVERRLSKS